MNNSISTKLISRKLAVIALKQSYSAGKRNFSGINLNRACLERESLNGIILHRADLSEANLSNSELKNVNLSHAKLSGADLSGANLAGADLTQANLCAANLLHANLVDAKLTLAIYDERTKFPLGFSPFTREMIAISEIAA